MENVRCKLAPYGTQMRKISTSLFTFECDTNYPNSNICETRRYFEFTSAEACLGKFCGAIYGALVLRDPSGENKGNFGRCLGASLNIPSSNICETRPYFEFTPTNRMSGKKLWAEIFGPKVGKVAYF